MLFCRYLKGNKGVLINKNKDQLFFFKNDGFGKQHDLTLCMHKSIREMIVVQYIGSKRVV